MTRQDAQYPRPTTTPDNPTTTKKMKYLGSLVTKTCKVLAAATDSEYLTFNNISEKLHHVEDEDHKLGRLQNILDDLAEVDILISGTFDSVILYKMNFVRRTNIKDKVPASCPRCGGWTNFGGKSQYYHTTKGCRC